MIKILKYGEVENKDIFSRVVPEVNVEDIVADIIKNVRENGDKALFEYCEKFDGARLSSLLVTNEEIDEAFSSVEPEFIAVLDGSEYKVRVKVAGEHNVYNALAAICVGRAFDVPMDKILKCIESFELTAMRMSV